MASAGQIPLTESSFLINSDQTSGERLDRCFFAVCEGDPTLDPHKALRRVSKGGAAVVSIAAKIPFIPIALKLGQVLGPMSIAGNTLGFFVLEFWAASGTLDDLAGPKTSAEMALIEKEKPSKRKTCRVVTVITAASLIALCSQWPTALAGVAYNQGGYKIAAGVVLLIAGSLIPVRSIQLSIEQLRIQTQNAAESKIRAIKGKMIALLRENQGLFIQKKYPEKLALIATCNVARTMESAHKTDHYISALINHGSSIGSVNTGLAKKIVREVFNYTGLGLGICLAGLFEYSLGEYTYDLTKQQLLDNDVFGGAFATVSVISTAYLLGGSIIYTTRRIFNLAGNLATGNEVRNLGWQLRPGLSFALTAVGLLADLFAVGPTYVIWGDFYKNPVEHQLFQKSMSISLFLILFTATLDIIDDIVSSSIARGSEDEKSILKLNGEFQKLAQLVEKSPSIEFLGYLTNREQSAKSELVKRMALSTEQLAMVARDIES